MCITGRLFAVVVLLGLCAAVWAQEAGDKPVRDAQPSTGTCEPKRSVMPDGTIVVQKRDCSVTKTPKDKLMEGPADDASPKAADENHALQVGKLREIRPQPLPEGMNDPKLAAKYAEAMNGYFEYYIAGYQQRQRVFQWQLMSSKIIFVIVTILVFSGIYFAALQFHEGLRQRATAPAASAAAAGASSSSVVARPAVPEEQGITKFSASSKGIEVSSPVLGVIILVISLAFFYLYLVYVYPISELF